MTLTKRVVHGGLPQKASAAVTEAAKRGEKKPARAEKDGRLERNKKRKGEKLDDHDVPAWEFSNATPKRAEVLRKCEIERGLNTYQNEL